MSDDLDNAHNDRRHAERSKEHAPQHESTNAPLTDLLASAAPIEYQGAFLRNPTFNGRGSGPVRATLVQQMQQTHGNRAARRFLTHISSVQRQATADVAPQTSLLSVMRQVEKGHTTTKEKPSSTGLAADSQVKKYVKDVKGIKALKDAEGNNQWATWGLLRRAQALVSKANDRLAAIGVETVDVQIHTLDHARGEFDPALWAMKLDPGVVIKRSMTDEEMKDAADTILHEARHAEQDFRIARMLAGKGKTAGQIAKEMKIPDRVAVKAAASPISKAGVGKIQDAAKRQVADTELKEAEAWHKDYYGEGRTHHSETMQNLYKADEEYKKSLKNYEKENKAYKALVTKYGEKDKRVTEKYESLMSVEYFLLNAAYDDWQKAHKAYRALPIEKDANDLEDKVETEYLKKGQKQ
ncbi:MAG TPA: hypothetical protein VJ183_08360 [Chloroflexia bacterium]|nr:hypothetical protein [Chloroflexia bacterium]